MAKAAPTTPLRSRPSFTSIVRLDIPFSALIEILPLLRPWKKLGTAALGIVTAGWPAKRRHRRCPAPTWVGLRCRRASPERPTQAGLQLLWCEVVDHLPARGMSHQQSSWPCFLRDRRLHDRRSSRFDMRQRRVARRQEPAPNKAAESYL